MLVIPEALSASQIRVAVPQIRALVLSDPVAKRAFGGQHYVFSEELARELRQAENFARLGLPKRQRVRLGSCVFDDSARVAGYQAVTVMQNATPNAEERRFIGLSELLNYVQLKKLVVRKDCRGKGVARDLLQFGLNLSCELEKGWCGDVLSTSKAIIKLLAKHNIEKAFEWHNRAGSLMWRMGDK